MIPKEKTMRNLMGLVEQLVINEKTVLLYLFYCLNGKEGPTREAIQKGTGMTLRTIRRHDRVLTELGAVVHGDKRGRGNGTEVIAVDFEKPTQPRLPLLISILNIPTQKSNASLALHGRYSIGESATGMGRFSSTLDIEGDADWLSAKEHLLKYFKPTELDVGVLTKKNRFSKLIELLIEESFDFPGYCKWYSENKYHGLGFAFGLFLYPSMIEEYKHYTAHDGKYLKTSTRIAESESFKSGLKKTKDFLKNLGDNDEK